MLRTEPQVLANQLLTALELSARHHAEMAEVAAHPLGSTLKAIAEERDLLAQRLEEAIRDSGDLPDALDPERAGLSDMALRAHTWGKQGNEGIREVLEQEDHALADLAQAVTFNAPAFGELAEVIRYHAKRSVAQMHGA